MPKGRKASGFVPDLPDEVLEELELKPGETVGNWFRRKSSTKSMRAWMHISRSGKQHSKQAVTEAGETDRRFEALALGRHCSYRGEVCELGVFSRAPLGWQGNMYSRAAPRRAAPV